jgi:hypothetical protein
MAVTGNPTLPARMARLPRDKHGRPVPWFVHFDDAGVPDFRIIRRGGIDDALRFDLCWVCGTRRGRHAAFVIGPMCAVNRTTAEPPCHLDCATYSARACPFLATPNMQRRERGLDHVVDPAGVMIARNPGVALVWSTRTWTTFPDPAGRLLFDIGDPTATAWWAHGRPATREEVLTSIETGLPILQAEAAKQRGGPEELEQMLLAARDYVPA